MNQQHRRERRLKFDREGVMCLVAAALFSVLGVAMGTDTYWLDRRRVAVGQEIQVV